jgi:hypothetical protein
MPDYGEILRFLAKNPPQIDAEKQLHASLLELLAACLRSDSELAPPQTRGDTLKEQIAKSHVDWVHFN